MPTHLHTHFVTHLVSQRYTRTHTHTRRLALALQADKFLQSVFPAPQVIDWSIVVKNRSVLLGLTKNCYYHIGKISVLAHSWFVLTRQTYKLHILLLLWVVNIIQKPPGECHSAWARVWMFPPNIIDPSLKTCCSIHLSNNGYSNGESSSNV